MTPIVTAALKVSALYVAALILMGVVLSLLVIRLRIANKVSLGDGGNKALLRAIRVHGNFTEHMPAAFAVLLILPLLGADLAQIHTVGALLVAGRALHAVGLDRPKPLGLLRQAGMIATIAALVSAAFLMLRVSL